MIGTKVLHYEILEKLGQGGMGVVYKAQDTKLDRLVALKFLPSHLNASEADKTRFIQEAKSAAALSHPNICTIFGIDEHDGQLFIAMELVDGQTLRERRETLSSKQAIEIAIQIADGLSAAHEKGIVHRDIKPENIMVRKDGIVQIMDFGLAKLRSASSKINRLTKEGSTVGTAGYMSPEQVMGLDVDHRSDIFSFGVVLYEMLAGQLPFRGVHETALAYEIVNVDAPPLTSVKPDLDPQLDAVVLDCLEKDPKERCQSMAEAARDLRRVKRESTRQRHSRITAVRPAYSPSAEVPVPDAEPLPKPGRLAWIIAGIFFLCAVGIALFHILTQQPPREARIVRALILPPGKTNFNMQVGGHLALSPDGLTVAFVATDSTGIDQLWVRAVSSLTALPLAGTEGATYPFWSVDSRAIAFFTGAKLKKIDAKGGPTLTLCDAPSGRGGTWNQNGVIVFSPDANSPLLKVSAAGGTPEEITAMDTAKREQSHRWPFFLPDGNHFLYVTQTASMASENDAIKVGALDKSVDSVIMRGNSNVEYASGYLLFIRQSTLMAQLFDPAKLVCSGEAIPIVEQLQYNPGRSRGMFASSRNGVLVFQTGDAQNLKLGIFDRSGNRVALADERGTSWVRFSPDGKSIAFSHLDPQSRSSNIWIRDLARGTSSRFTFEQGTEVAPRWSPHGDSIVFSSNRKGRFDLFIKSTTGTANEELLFESNLDKYATDWSRDGRLLAFTTTGDAKTKFDMWLLPIAGDRKPIPFLRTEFSEGAAAFSPDTRWLAYQSDETGRFEIYARLVDGSGGKKQVSINGGTNAQWLPDGKGIVFSSGDRKMMLATIRATEGTFAVDSIRTLFDYESRGIVGNVENLSPDGKTFVARVTELRQSSVPIVLVTNWDEELKKK